MRARLRLAALAAFWATLAAAQTAQWPPPSNVETRMRELQAVIGSRDSTTAQREAARNELSGLLKSPAGKERGATRDERPPRAAIEPLPSMVKPAAGAVMPSSPGVARVEVVTPPRMLVIPGSGTPTTPSGGFAIDPRTGSVLREVPGGYIDPRTGQVIPR